ncbi:MAG: diacylglycerol kinase (ATP) [Salibacteraceae bacterium]|jgi:YegS/Rv2252/BmrU family lipid kinase
MGEHWFFIINPTSGKGKAVSLWQQTKKILDESNIEYSFQVSKYSKHTIQLVKEAHQMGIRHFIGLGGDGTMNEIINGIFTSKTNTLIDPSLVHLIPVGTGNDWVKNHTVLHLNNLSSRIAAYQTCNHDVGTVLTSNSKIHFFINVAGTGIDGAVAQEIQTISAKGTKNKLSYLIGTIKALLRFMAPQSHITMPSRDPHSGKVLLVAASIGKYFGSGMLISPLAHFANGTLNITIVEKDSLWVVFPQLYKLFNGQIGTVPFIKKITSKSVDIHSEFPIPVQADGEDLGLHSDVSFSVIKHAIRILA